MDVSRSQDPFAPEDQPETAAPGGEQSEPVVVQESAPGNAQPTVEVSPVEEQPAETGTQDVPVQEQFEQPEIEEEDGDELPAA